MKKFLTISILLILVNSYVALCQINTNISFYYDDSLNFEFAAGQKLDFPWCGGIISAQFCEIDLNLDGIFDLLIYDRIGKKLLFFVASFQNDSLHYRFSTEYNSSFPEINNWIICKDFDNDGRNDIFTYTIGGIKVFRNISTDKLEFQQMTFPFLKSYHNEIYTNILATSVDYPGIEDLDGDGDLDILVFGPLGAYVQFHKNYSVETYGNADSLIFRKESDCWGQFSESDESNIITLYDCPDKQISTDTTELKADVYDRHTGSTFLLFDADGNGLKDLLLGDVNYSDVCMLYNNGSSSEALITDYTFDYPNSYKIDMFSFPVMTLIDVDKDGIEELIVSTFDPAWNNVENRNSVWLYKNTSINNIPEFELQTEAFFQDRMIDVGCGALPVFFDIDNDGDLDLFVGNQGYNDSCFYDEYGILTCKYTSQIAFLENIGNSSEPYYRFITADFAGISQYDLEGLYPAFFDIDDDGDYDLFCGSSSGAIYYFQNVNGEYILEDRDWLKLSLKNVKYSTPIFYDIDGDGHQDLLTGNERGTVSYYKNYFAGENNFVEENDFYGCIDVRDADMSWTGYSIPQAISINDTTLLIIGSEQGILFQYIVDDNHFAEFTCKDNNFGLPNFGYRVAPAVGNIDGDLYPDMIAGSFSGGLLSYKGKEYTNTAIKSYSSSFEWKVYPNPGKDKITIELQSYPAEYQIYDMNGSLIMAGILKNAVNNLSTSKIDDGIYIIKVEQLRRSSCKRWLKIN
ncbi:MAG: FG-GAP-like repeat-containing protein [Bacteroidales bacterium]|nr:FG-GAP-like repeat-containing protein [Bacteroidales bacterium]MDD3914049.1 FG-GAP-like repeat-containing protein [Bacteroidales bacterium]MDD4633899.1 FG-GAP-like repeat-containing protein [Bacteroidales bacterium]